MDGLGRQVTYLRLSLTDRCNLRCSYCAPGEPERGGDRLGRADLARLVRIFASLGVRRVRLTGGEPTLRPDLVEIVRDVRGTPGIEEVALTTNGQLLATLAAPLRAAGVAKLNVSLDSLDPERLRRIAGRSASVERIVEGIDAAIAAGYERLSLNVVVVRGVNEGELGDLVRFAWRHGATPRFIELMPFGLGEPVPTAEVKSLLAAQGVALEPDATRGWGPAHHMRGRASGGAGAAEGLVGFIGAMTEGFCDACNRVRVSADGALRACLGGREGLPLAPLLASGTPDEDLAAQIRAALLTKRDRHHMAEERGALLPMIGTGG